MTQSEKELIQFALTPIERIGPWDTDDVPELHWFGLSDGCYWLDVGGEELFRYSDPFLARFPAEPSATLPYVDYIVARLHEDLLEMLPAVLEPVPADLADLLSDADEARAWLSAADRWVENQTSDGSWDQYMQAVAWWGQRHLDASYLVNPPNIFFWRVGETVRVRWDNRQQSADGTPVWSAEFGDAFLSVDAFLAAVSSFDERFLAAMGKRVEETRDWPRPDIHIEPQQLRAEQAVRERQLPAALSNEVEQTDWDAVRRAIEFVRRV